MQCVLLSQSPIANSLLPFVSFLAEKLGGAFGTENPLGNKNVLSTLLVFCSLIRYKLSNKINIIISLYNVAVVVSEQLFGLFSCSQRLLGDRINWRQSGSLGVCPSALSRGKICLFYVLILWRCLVTSNQCLTEWPKSEIQTSIESRSFFLTAKRIREGEETN